MHFIWYKKNQLFDLVKKQDIVDEKNNYYCSVDGVLFNKDKTRIISYPIGRYNRSYLIPDTVASIGEYAYYYSSLVLVGIPYSVNPDIETTMTLLFMMLKLYMVSKR